VTSGILNRGSCVCVRLVEEGDGLGIDFRDRLPGSTSGIDFRDNGPQRPLIGGSDGGRHRSSPLVSVLIECQKSMATIVTTDQVGLQGSGEIV
jgi:hypothetical protein